jgi:hypothetical protein
MKNRFNQPQIFYCEKCDYSTYNSSDFKKHTTTRKHILGGNNEGMAMLGKEKKVNLINYSCSCCRFLTINKTNYEDHLLTKKHQKNSIGENKLPDYKCYHCNKEYMTYNALWKHKKKCVFTNENTQEMNDNLDKDPLQNTFVSGNIISKKIFTPQLFMEVLKQSKELQDVLVEQNKELQNKLLEKENKLLEKETELHNKLLEQNEQHHKEIIELAKKQTTNINNHNNNTNNNQFNLQLFLNETCKDAMNIMDFVNSLKLTTDDFETTGKLGFVDGISRIFIKELKKLETEKLPIHCTDLKRETVYIKDNNIWEKENNEKQKLKWTIDAIAKLNLNQHEKWQEKYPECRENNTKENEKFFKLTSVALGGRGKDEEDKYREKIMKNVLKEVVLDKQSKVLLN